jgi:hypothetical protein
MNQAPQKELITYNPDIVHFSRFFLLKSVCKFIGAQVMFKNDLSFEKNYFNGKIINLGMQEITVHSLKKINY